jgi:hypothetical protein
MEKKYLPSKKFIHSIIAIIICGVVVLVISNIFSSKSSFFSSKKEGKIQVEKLTVNELIQNDTDGDKVLDWEEALWGTDKNKKATFEGIPDLAYIESKKKDLKVDKNITSDNLTETEKFAKEFFSTYTAMKASGQIDKETINNFSNALGQKIVNPTVIDSYLIEDIKINNEEDKYSYYLKIKEIFEKYRSFGLGEELNIISNELTSNSETLSPDSQKKLTEIAEAYQNFAKEVIETKTPENTKDYHLKIANSSNNTGISILSMTKVKNDPIVGLSGISQYQQYSDELVKTVENLETFLKE